MLSILAAQPQDVASAEQYHGLALRPFGLTPDQRFRYPARSFREALEEIRLAMRRREGLVVVTGDSGTGKTMLCRTLLEELDASVCVSIVLDPCLSVDDLLRRVLTDFGVLDGEFLVPVNARHSPGRHALAAALQQFLLSLVPLGSYAVIVIDEAQHLDTAVLEQLRLLLNYETDESKLLQVVLVGQPDLDDVLERPELRQLAQRVARRSVLQPLTPYEVRRYIERRVRVDGTVPGGGVSFTASASAAVARLSRGVPRLVNLVCDQALHIASERRTHTVDRRIVYAAGRRVRATIPSMRRPHRRTRTAAVAAAAVVLAVAPAVWTWASATPAPAGPLAAASSLASAPAAAPDAPAPAVVLASSLAPGSHFKQVRLERDADRVSLVVEMEAEPQKVITHTDGRGTLEVEVGPVAGLVTDQHLTPTAGMPFVDQVSVDEFAGANQDRFVRARVTLLGALRTNVRVVGSRVYVDFDAPDEPRRRRVPRGDEPHEQVIAAASPVVKYRDVSDPIVARLTAIRPFLVSAAAAPDPAVLQAVAETLHEVSESLRALDVPRAAAPAHTLLTSAVSLASGAVTSEFDGDRVAQAHRALALVDAARAQLP